MVIFREKKIKLFNKHLYIKTKHSKVKSKLISAILGTIKY